MGVGYNVTCADVFVSRATHVTTPNLRDLVSGFTVHDRQPSDVKLIHVSSCGKCTEEPALQI